MRLHNSSRPQLSPASRPLFPPAEKVSRPQLAPGTAASRPLFPAAEPGRKQLTSSRPANSSRPPRSSPRLQGGLRLPRSSRHLAAVAGLEGAAVEGLERGPCSSRPLPAVPGLPRGPCSSKANGLLYGVGEPSGVEADLLTAVPGLENAAEAGLASGPCSSGLKRGPCSTFGRKLGIWRPFQSASRLLAD